MEIQFQDRGVAPLRIQIEAELDTGFRVPNSVAFDQSHQSWRFAIEPKPNVEFGKVELTTPFDLDANVVKEPNGVARVSLTNAGDESLSSVRFIQGTVEVIRDQKPKYRKVPFTTAVRPQRSKTEARLMPSNPQLSTIGKHKVQLRVLTRRPDARLQRFEIDKLPEANGTDGSGFHPPVVSRGLC